MYDLIGHSFAFQLCCDACRFHVVLKNYKNNIRTIPTYGKVAMAYEIIKLHTCSRSKIETLERAPELATLCLITTSDEQ
jgi:hypothetical protein